VARYAAAAAFLAIGVALLHALWDRLTGAPCGEEYAGWVLGNLATGAYLLVSGLRGMHAVFGTDLPGPTLALLEGRLWIALLPLVFVAALLWVRRRAIALGFLVAANVLLSAFAFAAYAPMLKMCSCV
jgi:hypothetical protein